MFMKYIILIPAYEPDSKLLKLLREIDNKYPVVVVNDGSSKFYSDIFEAAKKYAHVMSYSKNMGKGYALKTGLNYIEDTFIENYVVVTMDADGQHELTDAIKLCDYVKENPNEIAIGKRTWTKDMPLRSRFGNFITRNIFKKVTGIKIYDTQSGLRAFSDKLNEYMLSITGNRFEYEMNVLLNLKDNNIKHHEIPITTIYIDNNKGSHFNTISDSYKIYRIIHAWKKKHKKTRNS